MAKKGNMKKNGNMGKFNTYNSNTNNSYGNNKKSSAVKTFWFWMSVILLSVTLLGWIYFSTGAFHSENLQAWQMTSAWFCPYDYKIYENNKNALVTTEYYNVKDGDKYLEISLDAEQVDEEERSYVYYTVIYYSNGVCVGQSENYTLLYDKLGGAESKFVVWNYSDIEDENFYAKDGNGHDVTTESYKVDSVRVGIFYDNGGEKISLSNRNDFSKAVYMNYVKIKN